MVIDAKESIALSWIRVVAMICIVTCHVLQFYENRFAWILNLGVQIFLVMSGFLYGHKQITNWKSWACHRILKVYFPFIVFVIIMLPLYEHFTLIEVNIKNFVVYLLNLQGLLGGISGMGHLWFITAIMICYCITPILQHLKQYSNHMLLLLMALGVAQFCWICYDLNKFQWILLYSIGYFYANAQNKFKFIFHIALLLSIIFLLFRIDWQIVCDYSSPINIFLHSILGLILCLDGIVLLKSLPIRKVRCIEQLDKDSYFIYLTHHVFALGAFSLLSISSYNFLNVCLFIIVALLSARILYRICSILSVCFRFK